MFETNKEAFKFLNKLGYFICKFPRDTMKLPRVCKKISDTEFKDIQGVDSFTDKITMNTLLVDNTPILNTIELSIFQEFDRIEAENQEAQKLKKAIKKDSKSIMNVKNGVLAHGYGNDYYVIDVDSLEALAIDKSLIDTEEVKYNKSVALQSLQNSGINKLKPNYLRQLKIWKEIGK